MQSLCDSLASVHLSPWTPRCLVLGPASPQDPGILASASVLHICPGPPFQNDLGSMFLTPCPLHPHGFRIPGPQLSSTLVSSFLVLTLRGLGPHNLMTPINFTSPVALTNPCLIPISSQC